MPLSLRGPLVAGLLTALASSASAQAYLTLPDALARAAATDPGAQAAAARRDAADAAVRQAAMRPPPALAFDLENLGSGGPDRTEATIAYERTWERGGKAEARTGLARAESRAARLRAEARQLDYLKAVQLAYVEAQAAEAELLMAEARLVSARRAEADTARRVHSARDPLFAGSRASALTAEAVITRDQAAEAAAAARGRLSGYIGGDAALKVEAFFDTTLAAAPIAAGTPEQDLLEAERDAALAALRVEQARGAADPTLRAGLRYFGDGGDVAVVAGASIPLQGHGANRANVERAEAERRAADADIVAGGLARQREIARLTVRLAASGREADRIRDEVIPLAVRAVAQVAEGYLRGGFEFRDVAEAERGLADARARRIDALRRFHTDKAELDRLTGAHRHLIPESR